MQTKEKKHSAAFPNELPNWFIKLFSKENDIILDPFIGSGTTLTVAEELNRNSIGIDIIPEYCDMFAQKYKPNINIIKI